MEGSIASSVCARSGARVLLDDGGDRSGVGAVAVEVVVARRRRPPRRHSPCLRRSPLDCTPGRLFLPDQWRGGFADGVGVPVDVVVAVALENAAGARDPGVDVRGHRRLADPHGRTWLQRVKAHGVVNRHGANHHQIGRCSARGREREESSIAVLGCHAVRHRGFDAAGAHLADERDT